MAAAYLVGSIPTGYWLGSLWRNVDVRRHGSGNLGATNVFRVLGPLPGAITLIIDILKGFFPVFLCERLFPGRLDFGVAVGFAAILGHSTSFWVHFKGGKGVATSAGVFFALLPIPAVWAIVAFVVSLTATRIVSISSIVGSLVLALLAWRYAPSIILAYAASLVACFVVFTHRSNIKRLLNGTEPQIHAPARKPA